MIFLYMFEFRRLRIRAGKTKIILIILVATRAKAGRSDEVLKAVCKAFDGILIPMFLVGEGVSECGGLSVEV